MLALLVGNLAIYAVGLPWLALFVGVRAALPLGLYPFVAGDLVKIFCALPAVVAAARRTRLSR
jgi:biotin transporter BioY